MTRCKVGDLCVIVKTVATPEHIGRFVRVVRPSGLFDSAWVTEPELNNARTGRFIHWQDKHLRPIRPQSDDATDETLAWKSVPRTTQEKESV